MTSTSASDPGTGDAAGMTRDAFLGGRLTLIQPARGYRAGVDPVLLAAAIPARAGQSVLDLGCGVGAALFCLATRVPGLTLTGVELQPDYAALARDNAALNGFDARIEAVDLRALPRDLRDRAFDHVIANPPYFDRRQGTASAVAGRETACGGDTPLSDWIETATRRLAPRGYLTLVQKADRLPELLGAMDHRLGSITVWPVAGRAGRPADRVLICARKEGRAPFRLLAPLVLHAGPTHDSDAEDHTEQVHEVLRNGAALPMIG
ncbi:tRNA1(Val) (adenine(37)-N6)-methyltransferase [Salibaculum sp.]|uniref:tRNA1(Val) (adenine(37)-N6)-methyltransferase n=1 Tax=Salibaculum sp. TaxID=2855480 RepID=UPI002B45EAA8|nr:methyltransferase [Salibaculum sp.]HKL70074.1 methyltransferase [Salibaculum sp.]